MKRLAPDGVRWLPSKRYRALSLLAAVVSLEILALVVVFRRAQGELVRLERAARTVRSITESVGKAGEPATQVKELERLEVRLRDLNGVLAATPDEPAERAAAKPAGGSVSQGYFDIIGTVERIRAEARRRGVACDDKEHFGFGFYAQSGPPPELASAVHTQRLAAERALLAILACGFDRLVKVERTQPGAAPLSGGQHGRRPDVASPAGREEIFEPDPRLIEGIGTDGKCWLRVTLDGDGEALRVLLGRMAGDVGPTWIRAVEWEPVAVGGEAGTRRPETPPASNGTGGVIAAPRVRFVVTLAVGVTTVPIGDPGRQAAVEGGRAS